MKNIEKVSIGGYAFSLESEAYKEVKKYLAELESFYKTKKDGKEILEGIEERMAELMVEKSGVGGVVSQQVVMQIIATLGRPSAIEAESKEEEDAPEEKKTRRRIYRDPINKRIGGVLAGAGTFFNVDATALRILFVLLFVLGIHIENKTNIDVAVWIMPAIYLVLWFCIPAAKTVDQRLRMKGEKGTVDEIQESVESGAAELARAAQNARHSEFWRGLGRVLKIFIGLVLVILGVSGLFVGMMGVFGSAFIWDVTNFSSFSDVLNTYPNLIPIFSPALVKVALAFIYILPFIGLMYIGLQMTFGFKSPSWRPGIVIFLLWVLIILALAAWGLLTLKPFTLI